MLLWEWERELALQVVLGIDMVSELELALQAQHLALHPKLPLVLEPELQSGLQRRAAFAKRLQLDMVGFLADLRRAAVVAAAAAPPLPRSWRNPNPGNLEIQLEVAQASAGARACQEAAGAERPALATSQDGNPACRQAQ